MRTITTAQEQALSNTELAQHVRVKVKDSGGTFRDLTTYAGINMLYSVEWSESIDDPVAQATVKLFREQDNLSLSPFMEASPLNLGFDHTASPVPLVYAWREVQIEVAMIAGDTSPASGDWMLVFHGYIDQVDSSDGEHITLLCRDLGAKVMDTYIENEMVFGWVTYSGTHRGVRIWEPSLVVTSGEFFAPTDGKRNGKPHIYECTTGGTTGSTEPSWAASGTTTDNTVTWTKRADIANSGYAVEVVMQGILTANGLSAVNFSTPSSPSWSVRQWKQDRVPVLEALRGLATQIGWDVRYKYDSGDSRFELTFYQPDRASPSSARTFSASDYTRLPGAKIDIAGIRNVVSVVYSDKNSLDASGNPRRKKLTRLITDSVPGSTSITDFGRRWMEIAEASSSNIDTSTEATLLADACCQDLHQPQMELGVELAWGFPWVEVGDYYTFSANDRIFSTDQDLAVRSYRHRAENGRIVTEMMLRGSPGFGSKLWEKMSTNNPTKPSHSIRGTQATSGFSLSANETVGGTQLTIVPGTAATDSASDRKTFPEEYEYHVSTSNGFTPSSSTLQAVSQSRELTLADLIPNTTYYAKVVPKLRNDSRLVPGEPSDQVTFTSGQAKAAHIDPTVDFSRKPLNGGFETRVNAAGMPDNWSIAVGTLATHVIVNEGSGAVSGNRYIRMTQTGGVAPEIQSGNFTVNEAEVYNLSLWLKDVAGSSNWAIKISYLDSSLGAVSTTTLETYTATGAGTWVLHDPDYNAAYQVTVPATAKYAKFVITNTSAGGGSIELDEFSAKLAFTPQVAWTAPSLSNSWVNHGTGNNAGHFLDTNGFVHLRGRIKDGTSGTAVMFTLPASQRPAQPERFVVNSNEAFGTIEIQTDGDVVGVTGISTSSVYLDGIQFRVP